MWIENPDNHAILYSEELAVAFKKRKEEQVLEFAIPVFPPLPEYFTLRVCNDHWIGSDVEVYLPLAGLKMPKDKKQQTPLLDLDPLPVAALHNRAYQSFYRFSHFNAVQTQVFFKSFHTDDNMLVCAPTGGFRAGMRRRLGKDGGGGAGGDAAAGGAQGREGGVHRSAEVAGAREAAGLEGQVRGPHAPPRDRADGRLGAGAGAAAARGHHRDDAGEVGRRESHVGAP